jgi:quercetin dioxygenase-like cupin family protein
MDAAFEMWEDPATEARFCFAHVGEDFSTGVLVLKADSELQKHNRPHASENLLQISGHCQVTLLAEDGAVQATYDLTPGTSIRMQKGQWHIHVNPFPELSVTQFKAEGDITEIVETMRHKFTKVEPDQAPAQL